MNSLHAAATSHPQLKQVPFPLLTIAAIYILTGGDYVSSFFRTSQQAFINTFLGNIKHIIGIRGLIETKFKLVTGFGEGHVLENINFETWVKLVLCVYLLKHKTLFNSEPIDSLYTSLTATSLTEEKGQLLKWLAYSKVHPLKSLAEWHDFTRRVCFHHSTGSKDHEALLAPSLGALKYHMLRSEFVIKMLFSFLSAPTNNIDFLEYGWKLVNDKVEIIWEDPEMMEKVSYTPSHFAPLQPQVLVHVLKLVVVKEQSVMVLQMVVEIVIKCVNHVP